MIDPHVEAVREKLHQRSQVGIAKYGTTTAREDLTRLQWLNHAQQEMMDAAVYLQRIIADETKGDLLTRAQLDAAVAAERARCAAICAELATSTASMFARSADAKNANATAMMCHDKIMEQPR